METYMNKEENRVLNYNQDHSNSDKIQYQRQSVLASDQSFMPTCPKKKCGK
jgi:hypothetical protein